MDIDADRKRPKFLFSKKQRNQLLTDREIAEKDTKYAEDIRDRARNIDLRLKYLFEDLELLHRAGILEQINRNGLKRGLDEVDPQFDCRSDSRVIRRSLESPDGRKISQFGIALGNALSHIYPGDSVEQRRLWHGMALGYFGHPSRSNPLSYAKSDLHDPHRIDGRPASLTEIPCPEDILLNVSQEMSLKGGDDESLEALAETIAKRTIDDFGLILSTSLGEKPCITKITDLPPRIQAVLLTDILGTMSEWTLTNTCLRCLRGEDSINSSEAFVSANLGRAYDLKESDLACFIRSDFDFIQGTDLLPDDVIEQYFPAEVSNIGLSISGRLDADALREIHRMCQHIATDIQGMDDWKAVGMEVEEVLEYIWNQGPGVDTHDLNGEFGKGESSATRMWGILSGTGDAKSHTWSWQPPIDSDSEGQFRLNKYGQLLCRCLFSPVCNFNSIYSLAFSEDVQSLFEVQYSTAALVHGLIESNILSIEGI